MTLEKYTFIILSILSLTTLVRSKSFAQKDLLHSQSQIDSILSLRLNDSKKLDTLSPFGGTSKYYKRIFKFIKIRTGKGETYENNILLNKNLVLYSITYIKNKRTYNQYYTENYYYIDNQFVKYVDTTSIVHKELKSTKSSFTAYFNGYKIIQLEDEIKDNQKLTDAKRERIIKLAKDKIAQFSK